MDLFQQFNLTSYVQEIFLLQIFFVFVNMGPYGSVRNPTGTKINVALHRDFVDKLAKIQVQRQLQ